MDVWDLGRAAKGTGLTTFESAVFEDDYSLHGDDSADFSLVERQLVAAPEAESSRGSIALHSLPVQHDPSAFKMGTVVAEFGLSKQSIRMWLVVAPRNASGFVNCIRVKSFRGRGIEGSLEAFGTDVDDQQLIDAHAILHVQDSPVPQLPAHLATKKKPLVVELNPDLSSSVLPKMSCALFTTPRLLSCKSNLALLGRLNRFSTCLAEIYYKQMLEGISGDKA